MVEVIAGYALATGCGITLGHALMLQQDSRMIVDVYADGARLGRSLVCGEHKTGG
jgi:hypothetical protein